MTNVSFSSFDELAATLANPATRPSKLIEFPAPSGMKSLPVRLWALNDEETCEAALHARLWVDEQSNRRPISDDSARILLETEEERQILLRALRRAEDPSLPLCLDVDALRRVLNKDMRAMLMQNYFAWCDECAPFKSLFATDTDEKVAELRALHRSRGLGAFLGSCDGITHRDITLLLADRLFLDSEKGNSP